MQLQCMSVTELTHLLTPSVVSFPTAIEAAIVATPHSNREKLGAE